MASASRIKIEPIETDTTMQEPDSRQKRSTSLDTSPASR